MSELLPYRVTTTSERKAIDASGRLVSFIDVAYETAAGDTGTVEIPKSQFSGKGAQIMVEAHIEQLAALRGLT